MSRFSSPFFLSFLVVLTILVWIGVSYLYLSNKSLTKSQKNNVPSPTNILQHTKYFSDPRTDLSFSYPDKLLLRVENTSILFVPPPINSNPTVSFLNKQRSINQKDARLPSGLTVVLQYIDSVTSSQPDLKPISINIQKLSHEEYLHFEHSASYSNPSKNKSLLLTSAEQKNFNLFPLILNESDSSMQITLEGYLFKKGEKEILITIRHAENAVKLKTDLLLIFQTIK